MKQQLATLGKHTLVYGVSAAALQAVGLVTLPVFARVFTPAEYGALELVTIGLAAMLLLADLGLASAAQRSFFDYGEHQADERRGVLATAIVTACGASLVIALLIVGFREPIARWLFDGQLYVSLLVLAAVSIPLTVLATLLREVMRLHFRAWHYAICASLSAIVAGGLGVALVLWTDAGVDGVLIGTVAGGAVGSLYGLVAIGRHALGPLSRTELRTMLSFGLPLIPAAAALWGLSFLDRVMLSRLDGLREVGMYAVAARFSTVVMFAITAFGLAFSPFILSLWSRDRDLERQVRSRTLTYVTVTLASLSLILALFAREAVTVIAPGFAGAHEIVGILCLGVTLFGMSTVVMTAITLVRRARLFALYTTIAAGLNLGLNLVLIPPLGGVGAALATATAYAFVCLAYYVHGQRLYPTPYQPRKAILTLVLTAALMPLGLLPLGLGWFALKLASLAAFAGVLVVLRVFDRVELTELRAMLGRLSRRSADDAPGEVATRP